MFNLELYVVVLHMYKSKLQCNTRCSQQGDPKSPVDVDDDEWCFSSTLSTRTYKCEALFHPAIVILYSVFISFYKVYR